jgi:DNA-binding CsgD family transcriptional regulator
MPSKPTPEQLRKRAARARRMQRNARTAKPLTPRDRRIAHLYRDKKLSTIQISEKIGLNFGSVAKVVRRLGLTRPFGWHAKPDPAKKDRNDRIVRLYREGLRVGQIIKRMRLSIGTGQVYEVLKNRGVPRRHDGPLETYRAPVYFRARAYAKKVAKIAGTERRFSIKALAKKGGLKVFTLRNHLIRLGFKGRPGIGMAKISLSDATRIKRLLVNTKREFKDIGREFGVGADVVSSIATGRTWADAPWPEGKRFVSRKIVRKAEIGSRDKVIARLYGREGQSSNQIARDMKLNSATVAKAVRRMGLTRPPGWHSSRPNPAKQPRNDRIVKLYKEGLSVPKIITRLGLDLHGSSVLSVLEKRGVARRRPNGRVRVGSSVRRKARRKTVRRKRIGLRRG